MGFFDTIFGKRRKFDHIFFGQMTFIGGKIPDDSDYFECRRHFKPSDNIIEIGINADISGPKEIQIHFYKSIEANYSDIIEAITPLIEDEFRNWKEGFKILDFKKEFEPVYLKLPRCDSQPVIWEIAFESDHDRNHTFTITMANFKAETILIDG